MDGHLVGGVVRDNLGWIEPGVQKLDGLQALWYARSRITTDDFSRQRRQRCLVGALIDQVNPVTMLSRYPDLARVAKNNVSTDLQVSQLPAWVELVQRIQKGSITSLTFSLDNLNPANPDYAGIRRLVQESIAAPATPRPTASAPPAATSTGTSTGTSTTKAPTPTGSTTSSTVNAAVDVRTAC